MTGREVGPLPRLAAYGAGLVALFGLSLAFGAAVVPDRVVTNWVERAESHGEDHPDDTPHADSESDFGTDGAGGLTITDLSGPHHPRSPGTLSFGLELPERLTVTDVFVTVVTADGRDVSHLQPDGPNRDGTWSATWTPPQAGAYRVTVDAWSTGPDPERVTATATVHVGH